MLTVSGLALLAGIWLSPSCPANLQLTDTTVGAITNSEALLLCVSRSVLIKGTDGNLKLVINSNQTSPSCLVYPNGLSPDLTYALISSGHVGCWSLYPPSQPIAIVNIGKPNQAELAKALKSFRPTQPRIIVSPRTDLVIGIAVNFSSTTRVETINCKLLGLNCQVRFTPRGYLWQIGALKTKLQKPSLLLKETGFVPVNLSVNFSVEYRFIGLSNWVLVRPNVWSTAPSVRLNVGAVPTEPPNHRAPRLVNKPCVSANRWGC